MKESFVIKTGTMDYDDNIDELGIYYAKQRFAYGMVLAGALLLIAALL